MATLEGVISTQIMDSRGEVTSYDQPIKVVDTTTLAAAMTAAQGFGVSVDTITDGAIQKIRLCISVPLPTSGIKVSPVAGSDNEKTGLGTFDVFGSVNKYGVDTPAIPNSLLTGNQIITGTGAYAAFVTTLTTVGGTFDFTDRYGNGLGSLARGFLTFRKHRRALRRA